MPLRKEIGIESHLNGTYIVLAFFRQQRSRYNSSRDFLTDLVKSHVDDADCFDEQDGFDEVVIALRREIGVRISTASMEPPFPGLLCCAVNNVDWRLVARYLLLELALDNLRSPIVEIEKEDKS